jgi:hypothetical protein
MHFTYQYRRLQNVIYSLLEERSFHQYHENSADDVRPLVWMESQNLELEKYLWMTLPVFFYHSKVKQCHYRINSVV